jgi:hypothetical protein
MLGLYVHLPVLYIEYLMAYNEKQFALACTHIRVARIKAHLCNNRVVSPIADMKTHNVRTITKNALAKYM